MCMNKAMLHFGERLLCRNRFGIWRVCCQWKVNSTLRLFLFTIATWPLLNKLACNRAYIHCESMEKLSIPISETSRQFHGSQRKILSVCGAHCVENNSERRRSVIAVILISEIIEFSVLFGFTCVLECLKHVRGIGSLDLLILGFDIGTHFRSYENMYWLPHRQRIRNRKCASISSSRSTANPCATQRSFHQRDAGFHSSCSMQRPFVIQSLRSQKCFNSMRKKKKDKIQTL